MIAGEVHVDGPFSIAGTIGLLSVGSLDGYPGLEVLLEDGGFAGLAIIYHGLGLLYLCLKRG